MKTSSMQKIMLLFDYVYYRLNKFYYKWDGENGTTSSIGVSMLQSLLIVNTVIVFLKICMSKQQIHNAGDNLKFGYILLFIILNIYNFKFRYHNKYDLFKEYWKDETKKQKTERGFMVVLALVLPWLFIISLAYV